jgi:hypothetical protein
MPVYLCRSGSGHDEPWRYGIQVYSSPFSIVDARAGGGLVAGSGGGRDLIVASAPSGSLHTTGEDTEGATATDRPRSSIVTGNPIRRVRHAEVVLVDDVCVAYGRYWLRLRWPGHKGGFAGYIAMARVSDVRECK